MSQEVPSQADAIALWKTRVYNQASVIDEDGEHEWDTLAYGFFLGMGFSPAVAEKLRAEVDSKGWM